MLLRLLSNVLSRNNVDMIVGLVKWFHDSNWIIWKPKSLKSLFLAGISSKVQEAAKQEAEHSAEVIMATVTKQIMDKFHGSEGLAFGVNSSDKRYTLTDAEVKGIVHEALTIYDADKTGMVDYALESSG